MKTSAALILSFAVAALAAPAPAADPGSGSVEVIKETKEIKTVVKYVKYCYERKCDFYYHDKGYNYHECDDCKEKVKEDKECKFVKECDGGCDFYYKHHGWKFDDYKYGCDGCKLGHKEKEHKYKKEY
ncbi:hypothetical protein F5X68DRAFT_235099 [Plectosphaerella plurivora]|uniref:Uncharacterized protein n=1 Tax=Plectosphaerella plurivora TaxID=936078 RepID=A0A9P8V5G4_9PEZI|nr:hypothetical protein F5X68DRAFT_235099 [Plectosphaerella plurivora]